MEPAGKPDTFFATLQGQVRAADLCRRMPPVVPAITSCRENRNAGAWTFTRGERLASWDPHVVTATSFGDKEWAYLMVVDTSGSPCGAYRIGTADWPRALEVVLDIFDSRWNSFPGYGRCRTTYWNRKWRRWVSKDDGQPIPFLPSCRIESDTFVRKQHGTEARA